MDHQRRRTVSSTLSPLSSSDSRQSLIPSSKKVLPNISSDKPLNVPLPVLRHGKPHPEPYFILPTKILKVPDRTPPWIEARKKKERRNRDLWNENSGVRHRVIEDILKDFLRDKILQISSTLLDEHKATKKIENQWTEWLEENVVLPTLRDCIGRMLWKTLRNEALELNDKQFHELRKKFGDKIDVEERLFLEQNYPEPPSSNGFILVKDLPYSKVVYYLKSLMLDRIRKENFAARRLREMIVSEIASKVLFGEICNRIEEEMMEMDEREKLCNPPSRIWNNK